MFMEPAGNGLHSRRCDHNLHASPSGCSGPPSPAVLHSAAKQGVWGCIALSQHSTTSRKWAPGWGAQLQRRTFHVDRQDFKAVRVGVHQRQHRDA